MKYFIYLIENIKNNKKYIGLSVNLKRRWSEHQRKNSCPKLFNAIKKYGAENFTLKTLEECSSIQEAADKEREYIQKFDTIKTGYNISSGADSTSSWVPYNKGKLKASSGKVYKAYLSGKSISAIEKQFNISDKTIRKYIELEILNGKS